MTAVQTQSHETLQPFKPAHSWLRTVCLAYAPGPTTPLLDEFAHNLLETFRQHGHTVYPEPQNPLDVLLTTAAFGEPIGWRKAVLAHARRRWKLDHTPTVITLLHATPAQFQAYLKRFEAALAKDPPDPADYAFPGLQPKAYITLAEQGQRGGPILALERLVQSQAMCIRNILVIGEEPSTWWARTPAPTPAIHRRSTRT